MNERRYDIGWSRVITMLFVFLYHSARFFMRYLCQRHTSPLLQSPFGMAHGLWQDRPLRSNRLAGNVLAVHFHRDDHGLNVFEAIVDHLRIMLYTAKMKKDEKKGGYHAKGCV